MRRKGRWLRAGVLVAALFSAAGAIAGPLEDGQAAYQRGDYAAAMSYWRPLAERGNAAAEFGLGTMYYNGEGVPPDYSQARVLLRKAVDHDGAAERTNLSGLMYVIAQFTLGKMYKDGQGGAQDYTEALIRFRRAAEYGFPYAQFNLGMMYENGQGTPQDYTQAHMWLNLAAARDPNAATSDLAAKARDLVAAKMTPAQVVEAQRMAREWKPTK